MKMEENKIEFGEEEVKKLIEYVDNNRGPESKNAWFDLGRYYLNNQAYTESIKCFQTCLRFDNNDNKCRQLIGEAYFQRGSYLAAMNVFKISMNHCTQDELFHILVRIAEAKQKLGFYREAILDYDKVLQLNNNYVPALIALAKTKLLIGQDYLKQFSFKNGHDYCEQALESCLKAIYQKHDLLIAFKLFTDICLVLCIFGKKDFISNIKINDNQDTNVVIKQFDKYELLSLAIQFASKAICLNNKCSVFWYNLSLCYYLRAKEFNKSKEQDLKLSIQCLLQSIKLDYNNWKYWNTLGVVSALRKDYAIAQHCFIKSIELNNDSTNELPWSNLGIIYLLNNKDITIAHKALCRSQSEEPGFVNCWIGLSYIANKVKHKETLDLFRHCNDIANHPQGQIGFINCFLTQNNYEENLTYQVIEALIKQIKWNDKNFNLLNYLGAVLQNNNNFIASVVTYYKCLKSCKPDCHDYDTINQNYNNALSKLTIEKDVLKPYWFKIFGERVS